MNHILTSVRDSAAAMATACKVDTSFGLVMKDLRQNGTLSMYTYSLLSWSSELTKPSAGQFATTLKKYGYTTRTGADAISTASTDFVCPFILHADRPSYTIL